jgi:hypothetical protein
VVATVRSEGGGRAAIDATDTSWPNQSKSSVQFPDLITFRRRLIGAVIVRTSSASIANSNTLIDARKRRYPSMLAGTSIAARSVAGRWPSPRVSSASLVSIHDELAAVRITSREAAGDSSRWG